MASCYLNVIIIGIPIFQAIYGNSYNHIPSIASLNHSLFLVPVWTIIVKVYQASRGEFTYKDVLLAFWKSLKTPFVIGLVSGLIYSATGLAYPNYLKGIGTFIGDCVVVLSLVCVGSFLHMNSFISCHWAQLVGCLILRFIISPLLVIGFCFLLKIDQITSQQCTIIACLPTANASFLVTSEANIGQNVATAMLFWTMVLVLPMLIFWVWILDVLQIFGEIY